MNDWLKQFFLIRPNERRAILVLSALVLLTMLLFFLLPAVIKPSVHRIEFSEMLMETTTQLKSDTHKKNTNTTPLESLKLHPFDPNTCSKEELISMGISTKLASTWTNFLSKGAKFYKQEDLQKLYGMNDKLYKELIKFTIFPSPKEYTEKNWKASTFPITASKNKPYVNLNTADTAELVKLPFIGTKRALMIVKYRQVLGGYVYMNQLLEVYGINDTVFQQFKDYLFIEKEFKPTTLSINTKQEKELGKHPYLRSLAKSIVQYRKEHGPFKSKEDLRKMYIMDDANLERILPYINYYLE